MPSLKLSITCIKFNSSRYATSPQYRHTITCNRDTVMKTIKEKFLITDFFSIRIQRKKTCVTDILQSCIAESLLVQNPY